VFSDSGKKLLVSSTKGFTGHTLGAAGITEAIICQLALENQFVPANLNLKNLDSELNISKNIQVVQKTKKRTLNYCLSNSFGFGGNNASLIFKLPN
jgi:3-oxoacyl-[acyl-carrier-protein] synthase-1